MKSAVLKRVISFVLAMLFIYSATPFVFAVESEENDDSPGESQIVGIKVMDDLIIDIDVLFDNNGAWFSLENYRIQLTLNDGTTIEGGGINGITFCGERQDYGISGSIGYDDWHGAGKYTVPITMFGFTQDVEINIIDNPYWYLEAIYTDKEFKIVFTKPSGQKEERVVTSFSARAGGLGLLKGLLYTRDSRIFDASFTFSYTLNPHKEYFSKNVQLQIGNMKSNVIENFEWLAVNQWAEHSLLTLGVMRWSHFGASEFNGYTRGEEYDVDNIISLACQLENIIYMDDGFEDEDGYACRYINIDDINSAVEKVFGITDLDITKSINYDPNEPDKLLVRFFGAYGGGPSQVTMRFENGLWIIDESRGNSKMTVAVTDDLVIEKIEYFQNNKKGDFDGDGKITVADALSALRIAAKLVPLDEESKAIGDIDGDGEITVSDALAILRVAAKLADSL